MLPPEVQKAILTVTNSGNTAKISLDRKGQYHIQEEKLKKVLVAPPICK